MPATLLFTAERLHLEDLQHSSLQPWDGSAASARDKLPWQSTSQQHALDKVRLHMFGCCGALEFAHCMLEELPAPLRCHAKPKTLNLNRLTQHVLACVCSQAYPNRACTATVALCSWLP
jgi:hypothetical protein